jgi:hypothetical protein
VLIDKALLSEYVDEPGYPNGVAWVKRFPNLIVPRAFSKIHGLAGLRLGYGVSHPEVAGLFNRVRQPFTSTASPSPPPKPLSGTRGSRTESPGQPGRDPATGGCPRAFLHPLGCYSLARPCLPSSKGRLSASISA